MTNDILKLGRVQIWVIVFFVLFKFIRRPILDKNPPEIVGVVLLSFPNFCEAVIGTLTLTMIGLYLNRYFKVKNKTIYLVALILSGIYVFTQELRIHNLGGNNIYDPNDMVFSSIGLIVGFLIIHRIKPVTEQPLS